MYDLLVAAAPLMRRQHALLTIGQALELGANRVLVADLVRRQIWERLDRGLYGPTGVPFLWPRTLMAAVLVAPAGSLASHRSCAGLHRVGGLVLPPVEISVPRGHRHRRPGVIVHESTDLTLAGRCVVDGIPTTSPARLAMDLGAVVSTKRYNQTIRELRHRLGVTSGQLLQTYLLHSRRGRNGGGALRDWLDRYYHVAGVPESGIEQVVLDALIDAGVPAPVVQYWVVTSSGRYRIDLAYPDHLLAIEVDGSQHEDDPDVVTNDAVRTAALERLGWKVMRIRRPTFASDLAKSVDTIRRLYAANCGGL